MEDVSEESRSIRHVKSKSREGRRGRRIVDSGDALTLGIGAMTEARWKSFFDQMVQTGFVGASADYKKAYTLQFVNKGVGLDLRPK